MEATLVDRFAESFWVGAEPKIRRLERLLRPILMGWHAA